MKILGFEIRRAKALSSVDGGRGWFSVIRESYAGAWQRNEVEIDNRTVVENHAVWACVTRIAGDIAKMRAHLQEQDAYGIWNDIDTPQSQPLRKPNRYQTSVQFWEHYFLSKLHNGNVYVLKGFGNPPFVDELYILDPLRVTPMVSDEGDVFYKLAPDPLAGLGREIIVPAEYIIHDRFNCIFHPLVGLSPITAAGLAAMAGSAIQSDSANFFANRAIPPGILTTPGSLDQVNATELKDQWHSNYGGANSGKIAVIGNGMKFEPLRVNSVDAQLIEQLKWTAEVICSVYHVPPYKIGIGEQPTYNNIQALNVEYHSQALQILITSAEACLKEGLSLPRNVRVEFDEDDLLRMDSAGLMDVLEKAKGKMTVNEMRRRLNLPPVKGGDTVYLQEQDHSLEWLSRRDEAPIETVPANDDEERGLLLAALKIRKGLS